MAIFLFLLSLLFLDGRKVYVAVLEKLRYFHAEEVTEERQEGKCQVK